ncbi:GFA family protein [Amylibacter sp. IMCC11727]|uniref:GFA family protein n=1 Tax=Amylibacter sp. IMCC11727 TaxID=3039851 RepID=UPI00244DB2D8|nr:GFA family protein [Amylibacter sp. IMCC11727]WGI22569.1 GFA family protein [Amylibacter sp. IMCC11727]
MTHATGSCTCGAIRISAKGDPKSVGICHCLDCRKHHGAVFYAAAAFAPSDVTITGDTHQYKDRHFCPTCGASVFATSDGEVEIHLGILDTPNQFTPTYELWCERRENWLPEFVGMQKHKRDRQ